MFILFMQYKHFWKMDMEMLLSMLVRYLQIIVMKSTRVLANHGNVILTEHGARAVTYHGKLSTY